MKILLRLITIVAIVAAGAVLVAATGALVGPQVGNLVHAGEAEAAPIDLDPLAHRSRIFDRHGELMATFQDDQNRAEIPLEAMPETVVQSVLVVEDEDFYIHGGVSVAAISRAFLRNVEAGGIDQGGSTITQQLVKQSLLTDEQSFDRKIEEAFLALRLEDQMTKDEILERYLNSVYFGTGAYGVQAAAEVYFGIDAEDLNWAQGALLATLIRNPAGNDPFTHPERSRDLRDQTLGRLAESGHITQPQLELLTGVPLPTEPNLPVPATDYFGEQVKQELLSDPSYNLGDTPEERFRSVFEGGLDVQTTYDPTAQYMALAARNENIPGEDGVFEVDNPRTGEPMMATAAIASVESGTGAVRVLVGGPGFENYKYNLATQGTRQVGSSFKPFVLLAALESGVVPDDTINGRGPCTFEMPEPQDDYDADNYGGSRGSFTTITRQTLRSSNCAYLRLGEHVGQQRIVDLALELGVEPQEDLTDVFSLPLGVASISPLDMAAAYATMATGGIYNEPYFIERITDRDGDVIYEHQPSGGRVVSTETAHLATEVLAANVTSGTGTAARLPDQPAAGKTGTTDDSTDAWFVGFTPYLSTAVWMGVPLSNEASMRFGGTGVTGGSYPADTWGQFMAEVHDSLDIVEFVEPEDPRRGRTIRVSSSLDDEDDEDDDDDG